MTKAQRAALRNAARQARQANYRDINLAATLRAARLENAQIKNAQH